MFVLKLKVVIVKLKAVELLITTLRLFYLQQNIVATSLLVGTMEIRLYQKKTSMYSSSLKMIVS